MHNGAPSLENAYLSEHVRHLLQSYKRFTGRSLVDSDEESFARKVFEAPFALVSHGVESDPIFNYANQTALSLFEMQWFEFTSMPSRYSAEPVSRDERADLLARVTRDNFIDDYSGIRIAKTGRRFKIEQATVWNVFDSEEGDYMGQAAVFDHWHYLHDEVVC